MAVNSSDYVFVGTNGGGVCRSTVPSTEIPPVTPTLLSPANGDSGLSTNPTLSWNACTGATTYELQLSTDSAFATTVIDQSNLTSTSQAVSGLQNGAKYYWRVNATNSGGTGGWSNVWSFTTVIAAPPSPTLATPPNGAIAISTSPTISWNTSAGATSYELQVFHDTTFAGTPTGMAFDQSGITSTSQSMSGLSPGTTYMWRVNAINTTGTSPWSNIWTFTTATTATPAINQVVFSGVIGSGLKISILGSGFGPVPMPMPYTGVLWCFSFKDITAGFQAGYTDLKNTVNGVTVKYTSWSESDIETDGFAGLYGSIGGRVSAGDQVSITVWNTSTNQQTTWDGSLPEAPSAPTLVSPSNGSSAVSVQPTLTWSTLDGGAASFRLQVTSDSNFTTIVLDSSSIADTSFTVPTLSSGMTYYRRVNASNLAGTGVWSTTWTFTTAGEQFLQIPMSLDKWRYYSISNQAYESAAPGVFQADTDGLRFFGTGYRQGAVIHTTAQYQLANRAIYFKWKAHGGGYMGVGPCLVVDSTSTMSVPIMAHVTTDHSWNGSTAISDDAWYFTRVSIVDTAFTETTMLGNYDDQGGVFVEAMSGTVTSSAGGMSPAFELNDNYGGTSANVLIGEVEIKSVPASGSPEAPLLAMTPNGSTGISTNPTLSWNASAGATSYELQVSTDSSFASTTFDRPSLTSRSQVINGLSAGSTYYWRVNASNVSGTSAWSGTWGFTTVGSPSAPPAPTPAGPASSSTGVPLTVGLSWKVSTGAISYRLQLSSDSTFATSKCDTSGLTATSDSINGLSYSTKYFWRVNATNSSGTSEWSTVWNFTTMTGAPSLPALINPANGATGVSTCPEFVWGSSPGAANYILNIGDNPIAPTYSYTSTDTFLTVSGLSKGTTYYWNISICVGGKYLGNPVDSFTTFTYPSSIQVSNQFTPTGTMDQSSYRIVGMPGAINIPLSNVLSGKQGTDWTAYDDNGADQDFDVEYNETYAFDFTPGHAFWILSRNSYAVSQNAGTVSLDTSDTYPITLHIGWNLISDPFEKSVPWSVVQSINGVFQPIYSFDGSYNQPPSFDPYIGCYFYNDRNLTTLKVPYVYTSLPQMTKISEYGEVSSVPEGTIKLSLSAGSAKCLPAIIGFNPEAADTIDKFDIFAPPDNFDELRIQVVDQSARGNWKKLYSDFRSEVGNGQAFNVEVKNLTNEPATVKPILQAGFENYDVYLVDNGTHSFCDLKTTDSISIGGGYKYKSYTLLIAMGTLSTRSGRCLRRRAMSYSRIILTRSIL